MLAAGLAAAAAVGFAAGILTRAGESRPEREEPDRGREAQRRLDEGTRFELVETSKEPSGRADILEVAVEVNRLLEPELDEARLRTALDGLVREARSAIEGARSDAERVAALNRAILADREVGYISNIRWRDASLAAALLRRKGNCLATTTLYAVVGRELGLPLHAVSAPRHAFVRFEGDERINIETTAGGRHVPDSDYREERGFGDGEARDFGYGKSLTDDEFAAILLLTAADHLSSTERVEEALSLVERAARLWPGSMEVESERAGLLYLVPGRREEALAHYRRLAFAPPDEYSRGARASGLVSLASHHHSRGEQVEALGLLRRAFALAPRSAEPGVLSLMSSCFRTQRDFSAAAVSQELALLLEPDEDALTGLAIMYKNAERLDDAVRALEVALSMNPEDWNIRLILAGYMIRAGREDEGWRMFETVKEPRTERRFYHTNMAWFYGSIGKRDEFLDHLGKALALSRTPGILNYVRTEVDFDRYRSDAGFKALIEKHRARLIGEEAIPQPVAR
jgi:tetratricopeptide (TPR) repeat protein